MLQVTTRVSSALILVILRVIKAFLPMAGADLWKSWLWCVMYSTCIYMNDENTFDIKAIA